MPLWSCLDGLVVVKPTDYHYSLAWRLEAEHKLRTHGLGAMSDQQVADFVHYFWKALHPQRFVQHLVSQTTPEVDHRSVMQTPYTATYKAKSYKMPRVDFVAELGAKRQLIDVWASG